MNNPMDVMYAEHEIIRKAEKVIDDLHLQWETDESQYLSKLTKLMGFFKEYADGFHHYKEEQVLFPALLNHPDFVIPDMVEALFHHHEEFREYASDIKQAMANGDLKGSYALLTQYMQELNDHISAENDELFVLAESLLAPQQLEAIYFRFKDIDVELGEDRKQALEDMIGSM